MATSTSVMAFGSVVTLLGGAGVLWRFFALRGGRPLGRRGFRVPPYWGGAVVMLLGVVLQAQALMLSSGASPSLVVWFLNGFSLGSCLAVPGIMLAVSGWGTAEAHYASPEIVARPWRALIGITMVSGGLAGGLAWPITLLVLAIRHGGV